MLQSNNLYELLKPWVFGVSIPKIIITGIELDSRHIQPDNLFIAVPGYNTDGRLYIHNAISKGAIAVLVELIDKDKFSRCIVHVVDVNNKKIPIIYINCLSRYVSDIVGRFYGYPSRLLNIVGVTGTNGKTTVTHLLSNWVQLLGEKSAIMGTIGQGLFTNIQTSYNTTCSAVDCQKKLSQFLKENVKFVAMEVSSHGLNQNRVDAVYFNAGVFTNLSHDHLDYHGSISQYISAKRRFFEALHVEKFIINIDDYIGHRWLSYLPQVVAVTITGILPNNWSGKWVRAVDICCHLYGTDIIFQSSWGSGTIHSKLLGMFNVTNLLLALGTLLALGYPLSSLLQVSCDLKSICGRMEIFRSFDRPTVIIDYAHTPDALKKVLQLIRRQFFLGKIWCIFGCGGERDKSKRMLMGSIAAQYADYVIITNDNPRTENPQVIIDSIMSGIVVCSSRKTVKIIKNRKCAIKTAIFQAIPEDLVLIAGKGHEQYQIIGNKYLYHSDRSIVTKYFAK